VTGNFLHANSGNYFIVVAITGLKKFVSIGRKSCLFVCYGKQIYTKLWMVEGAMTLNGGLCHKAMEGKIRSRIGERCMQVFLIFFFSLVSRDRRMDYLC
jgi:hypothetical protein